MSVYFSNPADFLATKEDKVYRITEDIKTLVSFVGGDTLKALHEKIRHMAMSKHQGGIGCPSSVLPMLERIINKGVKGHCHPNRSGRYDESELYGRVHFRWDFKGYTINDEELEVVKDIVNYLNGKDE